MQQEQKMVEDFHAKFDFPINRRLATESVGDEHEDKITDHRLMNLATVLYQSANGLKTEAINLAAKGDNRLYRMWLMVEEIAELAEAMSRRDEVEMADGIGDLLYVALGVGVTLDLPCQDIFHEIHRSNMSKERTDFRMRVKGPNYRPPQIAELLKRHFHGR